MTGQQIYQLGKSSVAAKACIPLEFMHTPPRISFDGGWIAEFWYYTTNNRDQALYEPQYYMALELPSGHPIKMLRIRKKAVCMGSAPELVTQGYYTKLNAYLESCTQLTQESTPDAGEITELQEQWLEVQPAILTAWLEENKEGKQLVEEPAAHKPGTAPVPEDMVSYWKQEMAKAIREGNSQALRKAQQEMEKAKKNY